MAFVHFRQTMTSGDITTMSSGNCRRHWSNICTVQIMLTQISIINYLMAWWRHNSVTMHVIKVYFVQLVIKINYVEFEDSTKHFLLKTWECESFSARRLIKEVPTKKWQIRTSIIKYTVFDHFGPCSLRWQTRVRVRVVIRPTRDNCQLPIAVAACM